MKFAKQLEEYELPEWRGHYLPYKALKRRLEEIACGIGTPDSTQQVALSRKSSLGQIAGFTGMPSLVSIEEGVGRPEPATLWRQWVEAEALRLGEFVNRGLNGLEVQLTELSEMSNRCLSENADRILELRVLDAIGRVAEGGTRLKGFAELNHAALYKILKKHDKQLARSEGLTEIFPYLVKTTGLGDLERFDKLEEDLRDLSLLSASSKTQGLEASSTVVRLAAGLGRSQAGGGTGGSTVNQGERVLFFFLGSSFSLFLAIIVLIALPVQESHNFSTAYFLSSFPCFRVVVSILLTLWCMGLVAHVCDSSNINHMFLLGVDPRCRVGPYLLFSYAAFLTATSILVFGMYVVDYKWMVFPVIIDGETGFERRKSWHFLLYPAVLLGIAAFGALWPSRVCRCRYKKAFLASCGRTALAPFYPVSFADNVVGDVLTSLAKPLQDVPATICYFARHHPMQEEEIQLLKQQGDVCPERLHQFLMPLVAAMPFMWRALQCLRRFRDTRQQRHLWNFGKYMASLLVIWVSWMLDHSLMVVLVSIIATVYAAIWDITLDWGLGRKELLNCGCPPRARSGSQSTVSTASVNIDLSAPFLEEKARDRTNSAVPQATAAASIKEAERYFSSSTYRFCSICDVLGRLTWVLSLMPVTIVSKTTANRAVLMFLVSTTEILRRCMWAVLRLEYEQVANASGFRALLWVPSKLNAGGEKRSTVAQSDLASAWGNKANYLQPIIQPSLRSEGEAQVGA